MFDFEVFRPVSTARTLKLYSSFVSNLSHSILRMTFEKGGIDSMEVLELIISCVMVLTFDEGVRF